MDLQERFNETMRVLLVEDEIAVREGIRFHLEKDGYEVLVAVTASEAWDKVDDADLVVLDWMLPDESGLRWLKRVRLTHNLPVLMLTARATETDRVEGLDAGADDYLTKPFSSAELLARVRALLRRVGQAPTNLIKVGPLELDIEAGVAKLNNQEILLTRREFDLLAFLASNLDKVYSRQTLLDRVWGPDFLGGERTVDQHITQLRARLSIDSKMPNFIETVRGKGYKMRATLAGS